jgi:predicted TIM-barrel fold metal-dependent hydrolase
MPRSRTAAKRGEFLRIDGHVHGAPGRYRGSPAAYVRRIRREGIHAVVLIEGGATVLAARKKFGDFVIPVARVRMARDGRADVERWLDAGCRGIKFIRPRHPYSDERYWPMYEAIEERGAVAVFHTGYLAFGRRRREERPVNMQHMRAAEIDTLTRRFPDLKTVMAHFSNPWWEEAWKISWTRANVYADLSGGTAFRRSLNMWAETFAPNGKLMADSLGKLTFASDVGYFHGGKHSFRQYIDFHEALLDRLGAPRRLRAGVWGRTLAKLFRVKL